MTCGARSCLGLDENAYLVFSAFENMSPGNG